MSMISEEIKEVDDFGKMRKDLVRTVTRKAVYRMLKEAMTEAKRDDRSDTAFGSDRPANPSPRSEDAPRIDWERLWWFANQVVHEAKLRGDYWERLVHWVEDYYPKPYVRGHRGKARSARRQKRRAFKKTQAGALTGVEFRTNRGEDVSYYVNVVSTQSMGTELNADELLEVVTTNPARARVEFLPVVGDGRRVDACRYGATLSLVDSAVLTRLGKTSYPLHPYEGRVSSSSGHALLVEGWTHLPIQLGSVELTLKVLVVDKLHIDVILGVDALGAFGALIDVANRSILLQRSGETLPLGVEANESTYLSTMASSVRLPPLGQAIVLTNLIGGTPEGSAVLVEAVMNLPPALGVARSLGTIKDGQVVVEICSVSTEEYWVKRALLLRLRLWFLTLLSTSRNELP
ncbi:hypothetical protein PHMEG_00015587 [Phytophthora megakarya]|uniref:Uncharacterized protein n=1 Tax=Phytophthora megakarya TaxID=4795 RepID=A0A225W1C6_9STRA|nr:hypothetical protein PHMEG_00015587 [Phytophthora megakarya]